MTELEFIVCSALANTTDDSREFLAARMVIVEGKTKAAARTATGAEYLKLEDTIKRIDVVKNMILTAFKPKYLNHNRIPNSIGNLTPIPPLPPKAPLVEEPPHHAPTPEKDFEFTTYDWRSKESGTGS